MRNYKYKDFLLDINYKGLDARIRTDAIRPVVSSFVENMDRTISLIKMPPLLMYWATILGKYATEIVHRTTGEYVPHDENWLDPRVAEQLNTHISAMMLETIDKHRQDEPRYTRIAWNKGIDNIEVLDGYLGGPISRAVEAVLFSVVIGTWTAFETLAGDLWESAVNHGPKKWAKNVIAVQEKTSLKPDGLKGLKDQDKMIAISVLGDFDYDLRESMGSLLRRSEKVDFQTYDNIRKAYEAVFNRDDIAAIFEDPTKREAKALEAVRNLVVHKASKVDARFRTKTKEFFRFSNLKLNDEMILDGQVVQELSDPAIRLACDLVAYVDNKMVEANPQPEHDWII